MALAVLKVEQEAEQCSVCGGGGELFTPEEHDAGTPSMQLPLRAMLLHLNNNKVVPDGRMCGGCIRRAIEAYEFSTALSSKGVPPLSEKIRALRRRLHELTQKIDVFIVVGGPGVNSGGTYNEDDIIMVEKETLAAAAAADDEDMERARNARGDTVYQCSVCPQSFQRVSEYRSHVASHPPSAVHSCWTCGAQFATRDALRRHSAAHFDQALRCHLCDTTFQSQAEMRRHEARCSPQCPACGARAPDRLALAAHVVASHGPRENGGCVCPACFWRAADGAALAAHMVRHRQARRYVCGYQACILRFGTRGNLVAHIRKCHGGAPAAPPSTTCPHCARTFGSVAAMKRHSRVHRREELANQDMEEANESQTEDADMADGGEVEYLEVEALEDPDYQD